MDKQLPFRVEYAKSKKVKCNICHCCIPQNSLKISKRTKLHGYVNECWHHVRCILSPSEKPESMSLIANFDNIKWDDQELLKKEVEFEPLNNFKIEYASSGDTCVDCKHPINKGDIKISKKKEDTGLFEIWHLQYFAKHRDVFDFLSPASSLPGFSGLKKKDQTAVLKILPTIKDEDLPPVVKQAKLDALEGTRMNDSMKKQNIKFFTIREEIQQLTKNEMVQLLLYNDQRYSNIPDTLKDILSDRLAFGSVNSCTKCAGKNLFISGFGYVCTGQPSLKNNGCRNISTDPKRSEFEIPASFKEKYEFLKNYVPNVERRLMRITVPSNISLNVSACDNSDGSEEVVDHPDPKSSSSLDRCGLIDVKTDLESLDKIYRCDGVKYAVTLSTTGSHLEKHSIYKLQIWQHSDKLKYSLLHIWNESNIKSWKLQSMPLDMCIKNFELIFLEKSGNLWIKRDQFIKQPFKMDLIQ